MWPISRSGFTLGDRHVRVAELYADNRNAGPARGPDIRAGVANHDRG